MRSAAIYVLKDRVLLHPWQKTTVGLGISSEPYTTLPADASNLRLGEALLAVLSASGQTVPHPQSWESVAKPRLDAAGDKSEKAFHSNTKSVTVDWQDDSLHFEPTRNGGASGPDKGFHPLSNSRVTVAAGMGAEAIGSAVKSALRGCL